MATDVDLYVDGGQQKRLQEHLHRNGWSRVYAYRFTRLRRHFQKTVSGAKLKLDVSFRYAVYTNTSSFTYTREVGRQLGADGCRYLDDFTGYCFLLQKALATSKLPTRRRDELNVLVSRCPELRGLPPIHDVSEIASGPHERLVEQCFAEQRRGAVDGLQMAWCYALRARPAAAPITISFVGTDGSGKGTYLRLTKAHLESANFLVKECYLGYTAFSLPLLASVARFRSRQLSSTARRVLSAVYFTLLPVDFAVRRGLGLYDLILTDRHPLYEPVFRSGPGRLYNRLIAFLCPRPDLVVYLTGDHKILWQRKQETSLPMYLAQARDLEERVMAQAPSIATIRVDTTDPIADVFTQIRASLDGHV